MTKVVWEEKPQAELGKRYVYPVVLRMPEHYFISGAARALLEAVGETVCACPICTTEVWPPKEDT